MKNIKLTKNELKTKNIVLFITSILTILLGVSFFFNDYITFFDGCEIFYIVMLLYFGLEFTNYLLTRALTGMNSLYIALANIIACFSGIKYMNEQSNMVISITLIGWMIIMVIIKLIRIEDLRNKNNYSIFINIFSLSLFILLGFLTITNIYMEITNICLMLGFFFTVNGILNMIETFGNIKFCK
ncbi:MAG: hypothetical protein IJD92_04125 [Bacilli bacterium]|nr:hypothetical protein [Bacilli bacterium]